MIIIVIIIFFSFSQGC